MRPVSKIYISAPVTGYDLTERENAFRRYSEIMSDRYPEAEVVNPFELNREGMKETFDNLGFRNLEAVWPYEEFMKKDLAALLECDTIVMTPGWEKSGGCNTELAVAQSLNMNQLFEQ